MTPGYQLTDRISVASKVFCRSIFCLLWVSTLALMVPVVSAAADSDPVLLSITGPSASISLTATDFRALPHQQVTLMENGEEIVYSGVPVTELLQLADIPQGDALRGAVLSTYLLASARDDYQVVFSLWEVDPTYSGRIMLVADRRGGQPLDAEQGPLRLIIPDDPVLARSVRMLTRLDYISNR